MQHHMGKGGIIFGNILTVPFRLLMHMTCAYNMNLRMARQYAIRLAMHETRTYL